MKAGQPGHLSMTNLFTIQVPVFLIHIPNPYPVSQSKILGIFQ